MASLRRHDLTIFRFLEDFQVFGKISNCWKNFRFLEKFQIFRKFSDFRKIFGKFLGFWKIFRFFENFQIFRLLENFQIFEKFQIFWKISDFLKIFRFFESFQIFWKFLWPETWHLRHWLHCWQLRTTILTITLWPLNKEWRGPHSQFLQCFYVNLWLIKNL